MKMVQIALIPNITPNRALSRSSPLAYFTHVTIKPDAPRKIEKHGLIWSGFEAGPSRIIWLIKDMRQLWLYSGYSSLGDLVRHSQS
jgi:hypothetical protein